MLVLEAEAFRPSELDADAKRGGYETYVKSIS